MRARIFVGIATVILLGSAGAGRAADGDIFSFFEQGFGGGNSGGSTERLPQPSYLDGQTYGGGRRHYSEDGSDAPPVIIRPHRRHHPRIRVAVVPAKTPQELADEIKNTTIYTDKTLTRGDIVMTKNGLRVFNGSGAFPHTDDDFQALATDKRMAPDMRKELHSIDIASKIVATGY